MLIHNGNQTKLYCFCFDHAQYKNPSKECQSINNDNFHRYDEKIDKYSQM